MTTWTEEKIAKEKKMQGYRMRILTKFAVFNSVFPSKEQQFKFRISNYKSSIRNRFFLISSYKLPICNSICFYEKKWMLQEQSFLKTILYLK